MPKYYFNIRSTDDRYDDLEGIELQDKEAALSEARIAAREISADRLRRGLFTDGKVFEIQDAGGAIVGTVPFPRTVE